MSAATEWHSAGTDEPRDEQRDLDDPDFSYWAVIGPDDPEGGYGWTIVRMLDGEDMARGKTADADDAKRIVARWEWCHGHATTDMMANWVPDAELVEQAHAALDAEPRADMAALAMVQPGKTRGIWRIGQQCETVPGVIVLAVNSSTGERGDGPVKSWSQARNEASEAAQAARGDRAGTVAYAVVHRDGGVFVTEDVF